MVSPRPMSLISGEHSWLTETWAKPSARANSCDLALVLGIAVGVHEDDGDGLEALLLGARELGAHGLEVRRGLDGSVGEDAFVDFDDARIELLRLDDIAGEDVRARLIADLQRVAKPLGRHQQRALAAALEQCIGGDRGAHLDDADRPFRDRRAGRETQVIADRLHRGVGVGGAFRKELSRVKPTLRIAADDVGEGAAAIDPEIPAAALCPEILALRRHRRLSPSWRRGFGMARRRGL